MKETFTSEELYTVFKHDDESFGTISADKSKLETEVSKLNAEILEKRPLMAEHFLYHIVTLAEALSTISSEANQKGWENGISACNESYY